MKWRTWISAGALLALLWTGIGVEAVRAETAQAGMTAEDKLLLEKGLQLYEIDQELARITVQEAGLQDKLAAAGREIEAARLAADEAKKHAARVIRAYDMGERDSLWGLLFSVRSFGDALAVMEYLQMILASDRDALSRHSAAWAELKAKKTGLEEDAARLADTKSRFILQRERMAALQQEIDAGLARSSEASKVQEEMQKLSESWREEGVPLFRTYFRALAKALKELPDSVMNPASHPEGGEPTGQLALDGLNASFRITDEQLNRFLLAKNDLFRHIRFRFDDGRITASGTQDGTEVHLEGRYELAYKGDDPAKPYIRFRTGKLEYNGFQLPDTTIEAFEKEFDLGIYPQLMSSPLLKLQVTGVRLEKGALHILLKLAL
ncbi:coiled-coil domain-containing protein [Paenibacillus sp. S-38]|uniref:coiled-coil domain-containing protein n=1 Tax=Paenibacillus sp. S-38 TaxID=3416710 RepID=UPI003CF81B0B